MADNRNIVLSAKDIEVKFRVRDNYLTAIRGVSLDLYEGETFAIVGESGSGKSVFTKTFTGMLESNGSITNGSVMFEGKENCCDTILAKRTRGYVSRLGHHFR